MHNGWRHSLHAQDVLVRVPRPFRGESVPLLLIHGFRQVETGQSEYCSHKSNKAEIVCLFSVQSQSCRSRQATRRIDVSISRCDSKLAGLGVNENSKGKIMIVASAMTSSLDLDFKGLDVGNRIGIVHLQLLTAHNHNRIWE